MAWLFKCRGEIGFERPQLDPATARKTKRKDQQGHEHLLGKNSGLCAHGALTAFAAAVFCSCLANAKRGVKDDVFFISYSWVDAARIAFWYAVAVEVASHDGAH